MTMPPLQLLYWTYTNLHSYLQSVEVESKALTKDQKKKLDTLEKAVDKARAKFQKQKSASFLTWKNDEVAQYFNQSFQAWVSDNDPQYANFQAQLVTADANYNNFMLSVYGSKYNLVQEQRSKYSSPS
jgi:organic radical activating enzyme